MTAVHDNSIKNTNDASYSYQHNCYQFAGKQNGPNSVSSSKLAYDATSGIKVHLDRHIRKFWSGEDDETRGGSLINIRYLTKGLILYNNTFDSNIGHTGSALFINEMRDTKSMFSGPFHLIYHANYPSVSYHHRQQ